MVHEWGHLRWGLFDEYPYTYDERFYFSPSTNGIEATRCTTSVTGRYINTSDGGTCGTNSSNGLYDVNCRFYPNSQQDQVLGSFMSYNYLDNVSRSLHQITHTHLLHVT